MQGNHNNSASGTPRKKKTAEAAQTKTKTVAKKTKTVAKKRTAGMKKTAVHYTYIQYYSTFHRDLDTAGNNESCPLDKNYHSRHA